MPSKPSLDNLIPFEPGKSGNPNGRPKGSRSLTYILRQYMEKELDIDDPITKARVSKKIGDIINLKLISNAIKGDHQSIKQVFDRLEGMPKQEIDTTIRTPEPINIEFTLFKPDDKKVG